MWAQESCKFAFITSLGLGYSIDPARDMRMRRAFVSVVHQAKYHITVTARQLGQLQPGQSRCSCQRLEELDHPNAAAPPRAPPTSHTDDGEPRFCLRPILLAGSRRIACKRLAAADVEGTVITGHGPTLLRSLRPPRFREPVSQAIPKCRSSCACRHCRLRCRTGPSWRDRSCDWFHQDEGFLRSPAAGSSARAAESDGWRRLISDAHWVDPGPLALLPTLTSIEQCSKAGSERVATGNPLCQRSAAFTGVGAALGRHMR